MKLIAIIIILFCIAAPAYADAPVRPPAWETAAATKVEVQRIRSTATPTPEPYPMPTLAPYPEPEAPAWWEWLFKWIAE